MNETGFPSPAQGYEKLPPDLTALLIKHPASTYLMSYKGKTIPEKGIHKGDILVVDSSLLPVKDTTAVIESGGRFLCVTLEEELPVFHKLPGNHGTVSGNLQDREKIFYYIDGFGRKKYVEFLFGIVRAVIRVL